MIDIVKAKQAFQKYASNYDSKEPRIQIKMIHMYHVAENARGIARSIGLLEEEQKLAELIGLLHDIGRFEQVRLYHTFSDKMSIDHAKKGVEILFKDKEIRKFIKDDTYDNIIQKAIINHNKIKVEEGLSKKELLYANIIRDADNVDIYRAMLDSNQKIEEFCHLGTKDISKEILSQEFFENFKKEKPLLYTDAKSDMDIIVAIIAHIYLLTFQESLDKIEKNDYISKIVKRLHCQDTNTKEKMNQIVQIARNYINRKKGE